ncbi:protein MraZ [Anaerotruncus sp. CAG:390]|nr:protein MraZ [Anaerotruncus sp. CAG:390]
MDEETKGTAAEQQLPLMGVFHHNVDGKNRLFIPAKHRDILGASFIICPSIRDKSLKAYSLSEWNKYIAPIEKLDRKYQEMLKRFYNSNAAAVTPDSQGRVVLTPELVEFAGLKSSGAVIVGCGNYSEIWSEDNYRAEQETVNMADLLSVIESQGL